ncbi:GNAT family N-acetyltransferase [Gryllotalpicola koreensis]|uniref:GNAT family N-acetyltransferase n=1 Tax=Gryllotalpicola koreensis TaxID=993086 RepID=A0ABP7ZX80_9MICO
MVDIAPVRPDDRAEWLELFHGYLTFYEATLDEATIEKTFARVIDPASEIQGAIARGEDGTAIGLVHWLTHPATWTSTDYCYLEDLFVAPVARRNGAGAALIEHVRAWAEQHGSAKVYWLTAESNSTARSLYDRVATRTGFIQYQIAL